jgi:hypothetical protein
MQKNNIQNIYFGINTNFVENGVAMIQSMTYEDTKIMGILNEKRCKMPILYTNNNNNNFL